MDRKCLGINYDLQFQKIQNLNPSFDLARVAIAYHGLNRNRSIISKEVFEKAIPSLYNIPLVGRYIPNEEDFGSHDLNVVVGDDGKYRVENATVPFGVIPESTDVTWETITEDDGSEKEYMFANCVLWKRSYGYDTLVSQDKWSQSMEIEVNDYSINEDNNMVINDMTFTALCILGNNVEPCFESASVQICELEDKKSFSSQFSLMINDFKELTKQAISFEFNGSNNDLSIEEGGEYSLNNTEEIREETFEDTFEIEESFEEVSDNASEECVESEITYEDKSEDTDDFECKKKKASIEEDAETEDADDDSDDLKVEDAEDDKKDFSEEVISEGFSHTYNEMRSAIQSSLKPEYVVDENGCNVSETYYYLCDFNDSYAYVEKNTWTCDNLTSENGRFEYSIDESNNAVLGSYEKMIVKWLTVEENSKIEDERSELDYLREYKDKRIADDKRCEINNLVDSKFGDITKTEEFEKLSETIYNYTVEEVEEKLFAIRGKHTSYKTKEDSYNQNSRIPVDTSSSNKNNSKYGNLFEKYAKRN